MWGFEVTIVGFEVDTAEVRERASAQGKVRTEGQCRQGQRLASKERYLEVLRVLNE